MKLANRTSYWILVPLFLALCPIASSAASLEVTRTRLYIAPNATTASLQLINQSDEATTVQTSIVKWTQEKGKDIYQKTEDIIVTPPVVSVAAHDSQIIRAGLVKPLNPSEEATYRLFIQEVAPKIKQKKDSIRTILRLSLPIFVKPLKENRELTWEAKKITSKKLAIKLVNTGNTHVLVSKLALSKTNKSTKTQPSKPFFNKKVFNYLLPHQQNTWNLKLDKPINGNSMDIIATTDKGEVRKNVALASP